MFNKVLFDMTIRTSFNAYNDIRRKKKTFKINETIKLRI